MSGSQFLDLNRVRLSSIEAVADREHGNTQVQMCQRDQQAHHLAKLELGIVYLASHEGMFMLQLPSLPK